MSNHVESGRRRRPVLVAALVLVVLAALIVVGCGTPSPGGTSTSPSPSGDQPVFRIGAIGFAFSSLNPFVAYTAMDYAAFMQMYPSLVQFTNADLSVQPDLAETWSMSADGKTWTFKLRSDGVWTDGEPITAADAAFTINTTVKYQTGAAAMLSAYVVGVKEATATDATTLTVTLERPVAAFLANIFQLPILPEHVWSSFATGDGSKLKTPTNDPAKETVVVAGPFTVQKLDLKGTTIFQRVDTFYGQKPLIKGFGYQTFTNPDAAVQALKAGQIDAAYPLPPTVAPTLAKDASLKVQGFGTMPLEVALNDSPDYTKHPELLDPKVREAIDIAIDRPQIVETVFRGYAEPGGSLLLPQFAPKYMSSPLPVATRDVTQANAILDGLGYKKGSDGVRVANGRPMKYTILIWGLFKADHSRVFDVLKQNLADVGIALTSKVMDNPIPVFMGKDAKYRDYEGWLAVYGLTPDPDFSLLVYTGPMRGAYNPCGYSNAAYDKLYNEQNTATDAAARTAVIDKMVAKLQKDRVEIPLVYWQMATAWNAKWQNVADIGSVFGFFSYVDKTQFTKLALAQ
jgi:peptide/nickel transport system substrate-binding protein